VSLELRLDELEHRLEQIEAEWADPEVAADPTRSRQLGREQAQLTPIVDAYRELRRVREELESAQHSRATESDSELREMANELVDEKQRREAELVERLRVLLLPRDPNDDRNVIIEIRAGAGGEEAALFGAQLFRMYTRYAERHRWQSEILTANETGIGGLKEVIFEVKGDGAYSRLKFEAGVHRVQRVPETGVVGADPHINSHRCCSTRGRRSRHPDRRGQGPAHRGQALVGPRRPVRQHH
jgi:peptide chain release factor 1